MIHFSKVTMKKKISRNKTCRKVHQKNSRNTPAPLRSFMFLNVHRNFWWAKILNFKNVKVVYFVTTKHGVTVMNRKEIASINTFQILGYWISMMILLDRCRFLEIFCHFGPFPRNEVSEFRSSCVCGEKKPDGDLFFQVEAP